MKLIYNYPGICYLFLLNEYINNSIFFNGHYRDRAGSLAVHFSLYAIRLYSTLEIYFKIAKRNSNHFVQKITKISPILNELVNAPGTKLKNIEFIKANEIVYSVNGTVTSCFNKASNVTFKKEAFDFIVCTELGANNVVYKKLLYDFPKYETDFTCIPAEFKFLLSEILVGNKVINAKFTNANENYFVVGNEFDSVFVKYYLNKYHKTEIVGLTEDEIQNFTLKVLDSNVDDKIFTGTKILKINKENYEIISR